MKFNMSSYFATKVKEKSFSGRRADMLKNKSNKISFD